MNSLKQLRFNNRFARLGEAFFQAKEPVPCSNPYLIHYNEEGGRLIGLDPAAAQSSALVQQLSGNEVPPGAESLAMAYSGHQFGVYNPQLGDGRGLLLGEIERQKGETWDIYLKGCGPTRFSRGFDGRATLRSSIREYLAQEALAGLGIPTTRSLALIGIGELIYREYPEPAAIVTRLARTHIRFGSFEFFHYTNQPERVQELADHLLQHHFPHLNAEQDRYRLLFHEILDLTARLIASWQAAGFCHGVMNTDNMSVLGETFDYGPYGFMDRYHPRHVCNQSDGHGRYAYHRQPEIARWNLFKLGETLQGLIPEPALQEELNAFAKIFSGYYLKKMAGKLGLEVVDERFEETLNQLLQILATHQPDYTNFFRRLARRRTGGAGELRQGFAAAPESLDAWLTRHEELLDREDVGPEEQQRRMEAANPKFILRNYLAQHAIEKALKEQSFTEINRLFHLLRSPYRDQPELFERLGIDPEVYTVDTPESYASLRVSCSA